MTSMTATAAVERDDEPGFVEGFDDVEFQYGSGHTSGPWSGDEIQELEQLAEIVPEVEGE